MRKSPPRNTLMLFALLGLISASFCLRAEEIVHFPTVNSESGGGGEDVEAVLSRPANAAQGNKLPAGAIDDYDDRDPNACQNAVSSIPASEQKAFSVRVFADATHDWDRTRSADSFEKLACKGRGCDIHNRQNPEATKESISDLIEFMTKAMSR